MTTHYTGDPDFATASREMQWEMLNDTFDDAMAAIKRHHYPDETAQKRAPKLFLDAYNDYATLEEKYNFALYIIRSLTEV